MGSLGDERGRVCAFVASWFPSWRVGNGCAVPDEGTEDFDDDRVVPWGVDGETFEGVDATEAHGELVMSELFDGYGVAVGDVALLGHPAGPRVHRQGAQRCQTNKTSDEPGARRRLGSD